LDAQPASAANANSPLVIAVDGPAASGKGTIARALARHFDLPHLDTGLLYRSVALNLWRFGGDPGSEFEAVRACAIEGIDWDDPELRSETVSSIASRVSAYGGVRSALLERAQRRLTELVGRGMRAHYDDVLADIRSRDQRDSGRSAAPLKQADDAVVIDTSALDPDQATAAAIGAVEDRIRAA
jgi:cytidylate kinase